MRLRFANHCDLPAIRALMHSCRLPEGDIGEHLATFVVGEHGGAIVSSGGFQVLGTAAMLRSLAVGARWSGRGWGRRTLRRLLSHARALGLGHVYLLTTTASGFFARQGFQPVVRDLAPPLVRGTRQFTHLCPASAILMHLDLTKENS